MLFEEKFRTHISVSGGEAGSPPPPIPPQGNTWSRDPGRGRLHLVEDLSQCWTAAMQKKEAPPLENLLNSTWSCCTGPCPLLPQPCWSCFAPSVQEIGSKVREGRVILPGTPPMSYFPHQEDLLSLPFPTFYKGVVLLYQMTRNSLLALPFYFRVSVPLNSLVLGTLVPLPDFVRRSPSPCKQGKVTTYNCDQEEITYFGLMSLSRLS